MICSNDDERILVGAEFLQILDHLSDAGIEIGDSPSIPRLNEAEFFFCEFELPGHVGVTALGGIILDLLHIDPRRFALEPPAKYPGNMVIRVVSRLVVDKNKKRIGLTEIRF